MDDLMARTMVENLSKGINPFTGLDLPENDICSNVEVQKALQFVLAYCSIDTYEKIARRERRGKAPRRVKTAPWDNQKSGKDYDTDESEWTDAEDKRLYELYRQNLPELLIAKNMDRTPAQIRRRMRFLRKMLNNNTEE